MSDPQSIIAAFQRAAGQVPAYGKVLAESGVVAADVKTLDDFRDLVPPVDKAMTFGRFGVNDLCAGGQTGEPAITMGSTKAEGTALVVFLTGLAGAGAACGGGGQSMQGGMMDGASQTTAEGATPVNPIAGEGDDDGE